MEICASSGREILEQLASTLPTASAVTKEVVALKGDIVLLRDETQHRNHWPLGRVSCVFHGEDGLVQKLELKVFVDGALRTYIRPNTQVVVLVTI